MHHLPNIITIMRIFLVLPITYLLVEKQFGQALVLFFVAGVSDALDGFLARHFHWQSPLGALLDPLADKLLLVSSYCCLAILQLIPLWLLIAVILRDLVIISGATAYKVLRGRVEFKPLRVGKLSTGLQVICGLAIILQQSQWITLPLMMINGLVVVTFCITLLSGLLYVIIWTKKYKAVSYLK